MKIGRPIRLFFVCAGLLVLSGCDEEQYSLRFSHALHVKENGMACDDCHGKPGEAPFTAISHKTCSDCHDEVEAKEVSKKTCGICHQEKQLPGLKDWKPAPEAPRRKVFVHTAVLAGKCADCHAAVLAEKQESVPLLKRDDVVGIRNAAHRSGQECSVCHVDMDPDQAPPDHDRFWTKRHGLFGMQDDAACSVCHAEDSCRQCHSVMQPVSHNNLWRLRTHGAMASWNRESCLVCHEVDSCQSCHAEARPRSHNARWEENHCYGCHIDTPSGEGCVVCHEEGSNVLLHEGFWPPVHNLFGNQANCYDCHNPYEN